MLSCVSWNSVLFHSRVLTTVEWLPIDGSYSNAPCYIQVSRSISENYCTVCLFFLCCNLSTDVYDLNVYDIYIYISNDDLSNDTP